MASRTQEAPGTPMPGTATEAAPTAPNNSTALKNEGTTSMFASPTDNRQQLEAADEPASAQLRRRVESCAAPEHEGLL